MFGAEGFLMDRCINKEVFVKAEHMINGFKEMCIRDRCSTCTPPSIPSWV